MTEAGADAAGGGWERRERGGSTCSIPLYQESAVFRPSTSYVVDGDGSAVLCCAVTSAARRMELPAAANMTGPGRPLTLSSGCL